MLYKKIRNYSSKNSLLDKKIIQNTIYIYINYVSKQ